MSNNGGAHDNTSPGAGNDPATLASLLNMPHLSAAQLELLRKIEQQAAAATHRYPSNSTAVRLLVGTGLFTAPGETFSNKELRIPWEAVYPVLLSPDGDWLQTGLTAPTDIVVAVGAALASLMETQGNWTEFAKDVVTNPAALMKTDAAKTAMHELCDPESNPYTAGLRNGLLSDRNCYDTAAQIDSRPAEFDNCLRQWGKFTLMQVFVRTAVWHVIARVVAAHHSAHSNLELHKVHFKEVCAAVESSTLMDLVKARPDNIANLNPWGEGSQMSPAQFPNANTTSTTQRNDNTTPYGNGTYYGFTGRGIGGGPTGRGRGTSKRHR